VQNQFSARGCVILGFMVTPTICINDVTGTNKPKETLIWAWTRFPRSKSASTSNSQAVFQKSTVLLALRMQSWFCT